MRSDRPADRGAGAKDPAADLHELNPQTELAMSWHLEVIAAKQGSNSGFNTVAAVRRPRDIGPVTTRLEYLRNNCSILGRHGVTEPTGGAREPSRGRAHYRDSEKASTHRGGNGVQFVAGRPAR